MSWSVRRTIWRRRCSLAESDVDAAIVDVSLGRDNSYPLADALSARGRPFALATGYGRDGIEPKYRGRRTLRKPFEFAAFRRAIDELMAADRRDGGAPSAHGGRPYLSDALIASSAFEPGQNSRSVELVQRPRASVPRTSCSSSASSSR